MTRHGMKLTMAISIPICSISLFAASCTSVMPAKSGRELIVCGWDEVSILDFNQLDARGRPGKVWSWKGADRQDLPEEFRNKFGTTDECKPCEGGRTILITSSGGAVACVERANGRVLFYAGVPNAHSAERLPNNRIAVASSFDDNKKGDRLILYDIARPDKEILHEELPGGHGAVWDEQRQLLWALSTKDIRVFKLDAWDSHTPKLLKIDIFPLPEGGGHDLYPVPGSADLTVTTAAHVWLFDRDTKKFSPHPGLVNSRGIKCVSVHPVTRQLVYVQAEGNEWWTENLRFLNPGDTYTVPGEHFYKARWNIHAE